MKRLCFSSFLLYAVLMVPSLFGGLLDKSAMVYYGDDISYPMVGIHDYIIVQPDRVSPYSHGFKTYQANIYAYVSIGEIHPDHLEFGHVDASWLLGDNAAWQSRVLDIANPEVHDFLLNRIIAPMHARGYRNFFFDTLDSYQLVAKDDRERERYRKGLITLIETFAGRFPDAKLILNRGFDIIDAVHQYVDAVLFESYYYGLSGPNLAYAAVSDNDREWLDIQIAKVKRYNLPVIALDYMQPGDANADDAVRKLEKRGLIPYVADRHLQTYGRSSKNAVKREVLMICNSDAHVVNEQVHLFASMPLEYLGYVPVLKKLDTLSFDTDLQASRYAGVIVWLTKVGPGNEKLTTWSMDMHRKGVRTLYMENFGVPLQQRYLRRLGIDIRESSVTIEQPDTIVHQDAMMGFEIKPTIDYNNMLLIPHHAEPLLTYANAAGETSTLAAIMPWGGYAYSETTLVEVKPEINVWVADPFALFQKALRLQALPAPDPTTENGRRLFFTHVDGDGIMNRVEFNTEKFSGDVLFEEIYSRYDVPHSVSVIEGETAPYGLYPDISPQIESIARKIYALDNVEGATHTYTHPFKWQKIENGKLDNALRLAVADKTFSVEREITGSLDYINTRLMPRGKAPARTVFWTGDCNPKEEVLEYIYKHDYLNINGGDTTISNIEPWLTLVAPFGLKKGAYYQIYTGEQNENVYTNDWTGPFWGYKKVIQTFELTDKPRRLKPINIYYHFYAGSKRASLSALKEVFDWSLRQEVMPIYTSEYIPKVMEFYDVAMAQERNRWLMSGMDHLRTVRLDHDTVDLEASVGVAGTKKPYVALAPGQNIVTIGNASSATPSLVSSNGAIAQYDRHGHHTRLVLKSHVDLELSVEVPETCRLELVPVPASHQVKNRLHVVKYEGSREASIEIECR